MAETEYTPFSSEPDAVPVRLIVRRVKSTPGSQLALFTNYSYHACITDRDGATLDLEADHRRHAEVGERHPRPQVRRGAEPSTFGALPRQRRLPGGTGDGPQLGTLVHAHRSARAGAHHQDPAATLLLPGRTPHPQGPPPTLHLPRGWPWQNQLNSALARLRALPLPS